jgi:hypothetical protein
MTNEQVAAKQLADLCFSEWSVVEKYLTDRGLTITTNEDGSVIIKSPYHPMTVGLDWQKTDIHTRSTQLCFALFGGMRFIDARTELDKRWKESKKRAK